jgi:cob(I)alamin adenosyltransferase
LAKRLTQIITRTGDDGSTGLADGRRVPKHHARIETLGEVDELNSLLGLALAENLPAPTRDQLVLIQNRLFDLGAELATPGARRLGQEDLDQIEHWARALNSTLPPLEEFILPGGCRAGALLHLARTVCRRAERRLAALEESGLALPYLNRLSDLLFMLARQANRAENQPETCWTPKISS